MHAPQCFCLLCGPDLAGVWGGHDVCFSQVKLSIAHDTTVHAQVIGDPSMLLTVVNHCYFSFLMIFFRNHTILSMSSCVGQGGRTGS